MQNHAAIKGKNFALSFLESLTTLLPTLIHGSRLILQLGDSDERYEMQERFSSFENDLYKLMDWNGIFPYTSSSVTHPDQMIGVGLFFKDELKPNEVELLKLIKAHNTLVRSRSIGELFYFEDTEASTALASKIFSTALRHFNDDGNLIARNFKRIEDLDSGSISYYNATARTHLRIFIRPDGIPSFEVTRCKNFKKVMQVSYDVVQKDIEEMNNPKTDLDCRLQRFPEIYGPQLFDKEFKDFVNSPEWHNTEKYPNVGAFELFSSRPCPLRNYGNNSVLKFIVLCNYCCYRFIKDHEAKKGSGGQFEALRVGIEGGMQNIPHHIAQGNEPLNFNQGYEIFENGQARYIIQEYKHKGSGPKPHE